MSHVIGNFTTCASIFKSLPSGYNLDFQEATPKLWESCAKVEEALNILSKLVVACEPVQDLEDPNLAFSTFTVELCLPYHFKEVCFRYYAYNFSLLGYENSRIEM
jgi:argininosuccinate lyase